MVNNDSKVEENRDLRILYIDDEQPVRQTLSTFLERSGFQVIQAENGEEGLEKFHTWRPSVVLVDLRMPGMGGGEGIGKGNSQRSRNTGDYCFRGGDDERCNRGASSGSMGFYNKAGSGSGDFGAYGSKRH